VNVCPYGAGYSWIGEDTLVAGVVISDLPTQSSAQRKLMRRSNKFQKITQRDLENQLRELRRVRDRFDDTFESDREALRSQYLETKQFRADALRELHDEIQERAAGLHDLLNLAHQVVSNCKAMFDARLPGEDPDVVAEQSHNEGAIYFAALQMVSKIDGVMLLNDPSKMHQRVTEFRLHGLVSKVVKIYVNRARERSIEFSVGSGSYGLVEASGEALSMLVEALIDNAVKYAPANSKIIVSFDEDGENIGVRVASLGPRIKPDEERKIFQPSYRAPAAQALTPGGMGFGLAAAMLVSDEMGYFLSVNQDGIQNSEFPDYYSTSFSFYVERKDLKEQPY
jgi:signal transduction histidine kinase